MSFVLPATGKSTGSNTSITNGEPDTLRGVSPVPREGVGNLPRQFGKAPLPYPTISCRHGRSRTYSRIVISY